MTEITFCPPKHTAEALDRLLDIAMRDTGQSRKARRFLLSWWNADRFGMFDLRDSWALDQEIADDIVTVFMLAVKSCRYPDAMGFEEKFEALVRMFYPPEKKTLITRTH